MKNILFFTLLMFTTNVLAELLPALPTNEENSPHKLFISSQSNTINEFDIWTIDSGYAYSVFDTIDVYVGTRVDNSSEAYSENGFLSGVSYNLGDKFSLKSTLHTKQEFKQNGEYTTTFSAEVSSRVRIYDNLDLHATLDYEEWQQGFEFGLGFRF